jgi:tRNA G10  N-methylase Trm11
VEQVLNEFAPNGSRVLDPFAGTGTTPLTAARLGREALFCEINPLLQFLVEAKTTAFNLAEHDRERLTGRLLELADDLQQLVSTAREAVDLHDAYERTFGESRFFDAPVYRQVLQGRGSIDALACEDPLAAKFLTVAWLAALIPASRLIRRGDVRFKTDLEAKRLKADLVAVAKRQLRLIASDLSKVEMLPRCPKLVCEDARHLEQVFPLEVDVVVTSPPYLNGTNYFRNTKVELWFLRCLRTADDLADFRFRAVTAGINDVTNAKLGGEIPEAARPVVERLEAAAYDVRIPRMVASYFADMRRIFSAIRKHLTERGRAILDIGDSAYGNVHVATDRILTSILAELGFDLSREIVLRRRMSRGGFALRQVLLVFDARRPQPMAMRDRAEWPSPGWGKSWLQFKRQLPHQDGAFAKRNWGHPLHSLCSYQGKMKPSLAHHLVGTFVPRGGRLLDPFAGVGTIPFEAALQGLHSWSFEISPAALRIASAKVGLPDAAECEEVLSELEALLATQSPTDTERRAAREIRFNGPVPSYYSPRTFDQILLARRYFQERPPRSAAASLVFACLLHILHGNRPYALSRRSHPITPFAPTGPAEYRPLLPRLREKVARSLAEPRGGAFVPGKVYFQDATSWWPREVANLDAVITSPPFFDSTRFYLANWIRLWFSGWEADDFKIQPLAFVDERQKKSFEIYEPVFRQARERLKPDGVVVLHLGKSRKCDMAQALVSVALRWFRVADLFTEQVAHCESHGIRDKGAVTAHQYLVLR